MDPADRQMGGAAGRRRRERRARRLATAVSAALVLSLTAPGASAKKPIKGNTESRATDCSSFEGVFRALGRYTPHLPIGAPVPGKEPGEIDFENFRFLGRDILGCSPDCDLGVGASSKEASFALSYRAGTLRWATIHAASGKVVARGEHPWDCERGKLVASSSGWVNGLPYGVIAFGKAKTKNFLVINTDDWLVAYDKHSMKGTAFLVVPTVGSTLRNWLEFPPDPDLQVDFATVFDGPEPTAMPKAAPTHRERSNTAYGGPSEGPMKVTLRRLQPKAIDGMLFLLEETGSKRRKDKYYNTSATVSVTRGRERETLHLTRDHSGADVPYVRVFGREIGLEIGRTRRAFNEAILWLLPQPPTPRPNSPGSPPFRQALTQLRASQVGDFTLTLEAVAHDDVVVDLDADTVTITAARATIIAEKGPSRERIQLSTTYSSALVYERVFDHEIALEVAVHQNSPRRAMAVVWVRRADERLAHARATGIRATYGTIPQCRSE